MSSFHSPNAERFTFPLCPHVGTQKRRWISVGHPFIHLVDALSGKRGLWHDASWNDLPLDVWTQVWTSSWMDVSVHLLTTFFISRLDFRFRNRSINYIEFGIWFINEKLAGSVRDSTLLKRLGFVALLTFRLTEQGTHTSSAHEMKQAISLHRHIPVPAVFLLLM